MIRGIILDLDGTVYSGDAPIDGAAWFVDLMRRNKLRCLFVTNRANRTPDKIAAQLKKQNIPCTRNDVFTAAQATAMYLKKGRAFLIGEEGLQKAMRKAGHVLTSTKPDYVVVSIDRQFTYKKLKQACSLIRLGAKFIATNPDKGLPMADGIVPGTGSIVAAVAAGSGVSPFVVGKPEKLIMDIAVRRLGMKKREVICVGDNLETDILAGIRAGIRTALILTGISSRKDIATTGIHPTWTVRNYKELAKLILHSQQYTGNKRVACVLNKGWSG